MKPKNLLILFLLMAYFISCKRSNCHNGIKDDDEIGVDCGGICPECPPKVETLFALYVTDTSAFLSMKYQGNTSSKFNSKGICFSTSPEPTIYDSYIGFLNSGLYPTDGTYEGYVRTLEPNTKYYLRGFVKDDKAIAYGNELGFTTNNVILSLAEVSTNAVSSITQNSAISGGNITGNGNSPVTARGICYSSTTNTPTIMNSIVAGGSGLGSFSSNLEALTPSTTYYVRAYATNSIGTAYGNPVSFKTNSPFRIGQSYGGGVIAYLDSTNFHGLIAAPKDQSVGVIWSDGLSSTFATDTSIGTGKINTNKIVTNQGAGIYAASICQNLTLGGYSDWYLPSKNELEQLYFNRALIGGFIDDWYWSSTEGSRFVYAMVHHFGNGSKSVGLVERQTWRVRAIRSF